METFSKLKPQHRKTKRCFNESEGVVPAVCLKKVIQNQSVPITLKNSIEYKESIKARSNSQYEHMPPIKEDSPTANGERGKVEKPLPATPTSDRTLSSDISLKSSSSSNDGGAKMPKVPSAPKHVPPPPPPPPAELTQSHDEIWYSIEKYVDAVGDGISFEKGEKFNVLIKETNGWWLVKNLNGDVEGWAPSSYLSVSITLLAFK